MKSTTLIALALFLIGWGVTACAPLEQVVKAYNPDKNAPGSVLFQDDFSDPSGGWRTANTINHFIGYESGGFRFLIAETNYDFWSTPGLKLGDVRIEVDATKLSGPDDNDFGVICRYQDEGHFYGLLVSSDGYYGISKMTDGEHTIIGAKGMQVGDAIRQGATTNRILAECNGNVLKLSVNGVQLIEVEDNDYPSGDVGLVVGAFNTPGVDVLFQRFIVTKP